MVQRLARRPHKDGQGFGTVVNVTEKIRDGWRVVFEKA
jgi:hypothetical protein